jgi:hypothetical protein
MRVFDFMRRFDKRCLVKEDVGRTLHPRGEVFDNLRGNLI